MKKIIFVLSLVLLSFIVNAQSALKLKIFGFSCKFETETNWSEWVTCDLLMVIVDDRVTIYSETRQIYDSYSEPVEYINKNGDKTHKFFVTDDEGLKCVLRFVYTSETNLLYIDYADVTWSYMFTVIK